MVKKLLTLGALAAVLSLQAYAVEDECMMKKPEINKIFAYKGTWYIRYMDVPTSATLGVEKVNINGTLDREVVAGAHGDLDRGFSLTKTYNNTLCNEAVINVFDEDENNVTKSNKFTFGDLTKCVIDKPAIKKIFNYKGTWYIRYTDLRTTDTLGREHVMVNGSINRNVVAGSHDPLAERGFSLDATGLDATICNRAKIVAFDEDGGHVAESDTFFFGDLDACACPETTPEA